jgi:predicted RNase H-like nuclease (RuvC/YqgF family)
MMSDAQKKLEKHDDEIHGLRENVTKVTTITENLNEKIDLVSQRVIHDVAVLRESIDRTTAVLRHDSRTHRNLINDLDDRIKILEEDKARHEGFKRGVTQIKSESKDKKTIWLTTLSVIAAVLVCYVTIHEYFRKPANHVQQTFIKSD